MIFSRRSKFERRGRKAISNLKQKFQQTNKAQTALVVGLAGVALYSVRRGFMR
jgi:hypothetical protein